MSHPVEGAIPPISPARDLLRRYALAWVEEAAREAGRGIVTGDERGEVMLVDGFAGADYPAAAATLPGIGAAALWLARDEGGRARGRVVALAEDPAKVDWLNRALDHLAAEEAPPGGAELRRLVETREGGLAALEALTGEIQRAWRSLLVLDPPAAGDLPLAVVRGWLERGSADLILRFPAGDLRRLARYRGSPVADLPPHVKRTVDGISRLLGDDRHEWVYGWARALERGVEEAVSSVAALYVERFRDKGLIARPSRFLTDGAAEHVLLLTRSPGAVLLLNRVVHGLREGGALPWPDSDGGMVRYRDRGELGLFASGTAIWPRRERQVDRPRLADAIARRFAGRTLGIEELLRGYVDTDLFGEDIRRALLELRRDGRAAFRSAGPDAEIAFAPSGARSMHHRPVRQRRASPQELTLALEPDEHRSGPGATDRR